MIIGPMWDPGVYFSVCVCVFKVLFICLAVVVVFLVPQYVGVQVEKVFKNCKSS